MPNAQGRNLGERLAAIANKHKKVGLHNSLKAMLNNARARGELRSGVNEPVYQMLDTTIRNGNRTNKKKNCGPKPSQWVGTKKNPAFNTWNKCSAAAAGGKRKTRRGKKSRRATRRRR
jgi:hypothetical protein